MSGNKSWALIAHGGAKYIRADEEKENREGLHAALQTGMLLLKDGGAALDAVNAVVRSLELNPAYNAGLYGSVCNEDGEVEMDASIMDGSSLEIGAVAGIQDVLHPVGVAHALLKEKAILLVGAGAMKFARKKGLIGENKPIPASPGSSKGCDTVGCVALDQNGNLAVATSTGGLEGAKVGRVGDVPLPGCGFYADNTRGAVSASGEGETIARILLASEFLHLLKDMDPEQAALQTIDILKRVNGEAGLIAITPDGRIAWAHNSPNFAVGFAREGDARPSVYLKKSEEK